MEIPEGANNDELEKLAREYAAHQMRRSIAGEHVPRHDINNASKLIQFFLQPDEDGEATAPELGAILASMRGNLKPRQDDDAA